MFYVIKRPYDTTIYNTYLPMPVINFCLKLPSKEICMEPVVSNRRTCSSISIVKYAACIGNRVFMQTWQMFPSVSCQPTEWANNNETLINANKATQLHISFSEDKQLWINLLCQIVPDDLTGRTTSCWRQHATPLPGPSKRDVVSQSDMMIINVTSVCSIKDYASHVW